MYAIVIAKGVTDLANNCELLKYGLRWDAVTPRRGSQSGRCHRSYKNHSSIKYGLHLDAVISRWAREHANEVGALEVTKLRYIQIYRSFYLLFIKFPFYFPGPQNYYISFIHKTIWKIFCVFFFDYLRSQNSNFYDNGLRYPKSIKSGNKSVS